MKKTMIFAAIAAMMMQAAPISASACSNDAVDTEIQLQITVNNQTVADVKDFYVCDVNGDHRLTETDVLYRAHEVFFPGGAEAGLGEGFYWGKRGYYISELTDKNGQTPVDGYKLGYEYPIQRTDLFEDDSLRISITHSDASYRLNAVSPEAGAFNTLMHMPSGSSVTFCAEFDDPFKKQPIPLSGIEIYDNGKSTGVKTGADGKATVTFQTTGNHEITGNFDAYDKNASNNCTRLTVMAPQDLRSIRFTVNTYDPEPLFEDSFYVYDADGDHVISYLDAARVAHELYCTLGYGDHKFWGLRGTFVCSIADKNGNPAYEDAAMPNPGPRFALENGDHVTYFPQELSMDYGSMNWDNWNSFTLGNYDGQNMVGVPYGSVAELSCTHSFASGQQDAPADQIAVLLDGVDTGIRTDANGKAAITLNLTGKHTLSMVDLTDRKLTVLNSYEYCCLAPAEKLAAPVTPAAETAAASAQTTVSAETTAAPAQTTAAPANTVKASANGTVKTGSLKTGDSPLPLIAGMLCILSAGVAVITRRRKEQQN